MVRLNQVRQLVAEFLAPHGQAGLPLLLCGDFNACAQKPEPEMAWLAAQQEAPLLDCWVAAGDGGPGWTWDRQNPLTADGALLEPDQRVDVIFASPPQPRGGGASLRPLECRRLVYPRDALLSDHYAVWCRLALDPGAGAAAGMGRLRGGGRRRGRSPSPAT